MAGDRILSVEGVSVRFGGVRALEDVDVDVRAGTVHGLIGPNGAGKTTLFNIVTGLIRPTSGRVRFGDKDVTRLRPHKRARLGMARTFQRLELFSSLTVLENVRVASDAATPLWRKQGGSGALAAESLRRVGLEAVASARVDSLPVGTARLVELARAIATRPRILLLDEPASGLDPAETAQLGDVLRSLAGEGMAVLLVEHDMSLVMGRCDVVDVLDRGRVIARGNPAEIQASEAVRTAYLGTVEDGSTEAAGAGATAGELATEASS